MRVEVRRVWPAEENEEGLWSVGLAVAPGGAWIATGDEDGAVRLWHTESGRPFATLTGHRGYINAVAVAADGSWVASAGDDRTVQVWDVLTGTRRRRLKAHRGGVYGLAVSVDGRWLVTGGARTVRVWDVATGRLQRTLVGHRHVVVDLAITPDGTRIATASEDNTVRLWRADLDHPQWIGRPPGQRGPSLDYAEALKCVSLARDGTWLVTGGYDNVIRLWTVTAGAVPETLAGHTGPVTSVALGPDERLVASVSDDGTLRVWEVVTRREVGRVEVGWPLETVRWGSDERSLYVTGAYGPARYDFQT